jgi:uncharacterized lipoprotein
MNPMNMRLTVYAALAAAVLGGCESNIVPLRPIQRVEVWVPEEGAAPQDPAATLPAADAPATGPAVADAAPSATQTAAGEPAATAPATQPGRLEVHVVDPNQTARFVYKATYDNVWQQAMRLLRDTGFALDRQDYRLGVLTTQPLPSAQIMEVWRPQLVNAKDAVENTVNSQRRIVRLTISKVPAKPDFYQIAVQVLVERETNPTEEIGGPIFVEGSGFGRNRNTLRSDYAAPTVEASRWVTIGHDPNMEKKLIDTLFDRI